MKIRRSKKDWRELIYRQAESGLSAQQFCKNNGINPNYFSLLKKQLNPTQSAFIPVLQSTRLHSNGAPPTSKPALLDLHCGKCCLHFELLPDSAWLAQLVRALA